MPYLAPPPDPAPVVVVRDIGGDYSVYRRQTEHFRARDRAVQLHECRSACTLALSLPRVCVFPDSVLRFNKIYDRKTRKLDIAASDELFRSYPAAVRAQLGYLTRKYKTLHGTTLIDLGIRDCNAGNRAAAQNAAGHSTAALQPAYVPPGHGPVARFLSRMKTKMVSSLPDVVPSASTLVKFPGKVASAVTGKIASVLPTRRPSAPPRAAANATKTASHSTELERRLEVMSTPGLVAAGPDGESAPARLAAMPLPPKRPTIVSSVQLPRIITGAYKVLPSKFSAYAPLR